MIENVKFHFKPFVAVLLNSLLIAALVLGISALTTRDEDALRKNIADNAETTRNGVAAVVCILAIEPDKRQRANIDLCLMENGFEGQVHLIEKGNER